MNINSLYNVDTKVIEDLIKEINKQSISLKLYIKLSFGKELKDSKILDTTKKICQEENIINKPLIYRTDYMDLDELEKIILETIILTNTYNFINIETQNKYISKFEELKKQKLYQHGRIILIFLFPQIYDNDNN